MPFKFHSYIYQKLEMTANDPRLESTPRTNGLREDGTERNDIPESEHPVAPDQFDPKHETTPWEIWAYYLYYVGNNGLTLFNFAPTAFQNLLFEAAGDRGTLQFIGKYRTISSIVLLSNGISFAIQIVLFLILGSYAGSS